MLIIFVTEDLLPSVAIRAMAAQVSGPLGGSASLACEARYQTRPGSAELPPSTLAALPPLRIYWIHDGETLDSQVLYWQKQLQYKISSWSHKMYLGM